MARIFLNDREITSEIDPAWGLADIVAYLDKKDEQTDLFMTSLELDGQGQLLSKELVNSFPAAKLAEAGEVRIKACTRRELALQALDGYVLYLERTPPLVQTLLDEFRRGDESMAYQGFAQLLDGLNQVFALLSHLESILDEPLSGWEVDGTTVADILKEFSEISQEVVTNLEELNSFMLSDLIEFEVVPKMEQFRKLLLDIRAKMTAQGA